MQNKYLLIKILFFIMLLNFISCSSDRDDIGVKKQVSAADNGELPQKEGELFEIINLYDIKKNEYKCDLYKKRYFSDTEYIEIEYDKNKNPIEFYDGIENTDFKDEARKIYKKYIYDGEKLISWELFEVIPKKIKVEYKYDKLGRVTEKKLVRKDEREDNYTLEIKENYKYPDNKILVIRKAQYFINVFQFDMPVSELPYEKQYIISGTDEYKFEKVVQVRSTENSGDFTATYKEEYTIKNNTLVERKLLSRKESKENQFYHYYLYYSETF